VDHEIERDLSLGLEGVLFGALLFFSLLAFVRNRARKHGEIL
jgi:hypothetical protein